MYRGQQYRIFISSPRCPKALSNNHWKKSGNNWESGARWKGGRRRSFLWHELFNSRHRSKEGQDHGTCKSAVPMMSAIISKKPRKVMEKMEKLLSVWMQDQHQSWVPLSLILIQKKAKSLYEDLKKRHGSDSEGANLNAGHGWIHWFHWFKTRTELHNMNVSVETVSADTVAAGKFPEILKLLMKLCIYLGRFWMWVRWDCTGRGCQTKVTSVRKLESGYKAPKDRLTLLYGGNASGNMKLKPLLVYHSENPRVLENIAKGSLPVVWKSDPKAWVTQVIFQD